jgi:poly-gamma-glutamate synthesis protein (capsule biosynthesis protein)
MNAAAALLLAFAFAACSGGGDGSEAKPHSSPEPVELVEPGPPPVVIGCDDDVPHAACERFRAVVEADLPDAVWTDDAGTRLIQCTDGATDPAGVWSFALAAPLETIDGTVDADAFRAMWAAGADGRRLRITDETHRALAARWGPGGAAVQVIDSDRYDVGPRAWAIVPADELVPQWRAVAIDGVFPLGKSAAESPLAIPLCVTSDDARVDSVKLPPLSNIDPDKMTTVMLTGVTALTRFTGALMDRKGVKYPARDVKHWFDEADYVHISHEVAFRSDCERIDPDGKLKFCAKDEYIGLLEELGANVMEMTGSHLLDYDAEPLLRTFDMYEERGMRWFGGGRNQIESSTPLLIEHNGNRVAFVGCSHQRSFRQLTKRGPAAGFCDYPRLRWQVRDLRQRGYLPIVAIQHHEINSMAPHGSIVKALRPFAELGAVAVFGSQAHIPHPFESHFGAFVHYGLGNLFFDQPTYEAEVGLVDRLYFHDGRLLGVELLPTKLEENGRPRPMTERERRVFLGRLLSVQPDSADPWGTPDLAPHSNRQRPDSFVTRSGLAHHFLLHLPQRADESPDEKWPTIIFLHGSDESGYRIDAVRDRGLPKRLETDPDFPFIVASPQIPAHRKWTATEVAGLVEFLGEKYPIDPDRIYLTGLSRGAIGVWNAAVKYPDMFAAVAPVAAGGENVARVCGLRDLPIWAFHGEDDKNIPAATTTRMIERIEKCGGTKAKVTIYSGAKHNVWDETYANPELYEWFLQHSRATSTAAP